MPAIPNVIRRHGNYHFRLRVPVDLVSRFGRKELKLSLQTSIPSIARNRSLKTAQHCLQLFEFVRRNPMLETAKIIGLAKAHFQALLEQDRQERRLLGGADAFERLPVSRRAADLDIRVRQLACLDFTAVKPRATSLLGAAGLESGEDSPEFDQLCELVLRAEVAAIQRQQERDKGIFYGKSADPIFDQAPTSIAPALPLQGAALTQHLALATAAEAEAAGLTELALMKFSDFAELVIAKRGLDGKSPSERAAALADPAIAKKSKGKSVADKYRAAVRALIDVAGDKTVHSYRKVDIIKLKSILEDTPINSRQHGFDSIVAAAEVNRATKKYQTLSPNTINNGYLTFIKTLFAYALDNGGIKENIAARVHVEADISQRVAADAVRLPFSLEELNRIVKAPLYVGSKSKHHWHDHGGRYFDRGHRFWVPLAMLFGGFRPQEFGQCLLADVKEVDNYPCLEVTNEIDQDDYLDASEDIVKKLKTRAARRTIPLHPVLIALGFMDYVQEMRGEGKARLFPNLELASDGTYSSNISKEFNAEKRFLDRLGLKSETKVLYSLRHNYKDALRGGGFEDREQDYLMGHANADVSEIYGSRKIFAPLIDKFLKQLHYPGLDLAGIMDAPGQTAFRLDRLSGDVRRRLERLGANLASYVRRA
ncbi:MAG TPA: site-specific integrase [Terriglobia bacterium]|nr:site-specific integrase [Terriglobia bacterium]